jgi:hypothetical protein
MQFNDFELHEIWISGSTRGWPPPKTRFHVLEWKRSIQVSQKFHVSPKTLNLSPDSNQSPRVKTWDAWTRNEVEHDLWLSNDSYPTPYFHWEFTLRTEKPLMHTFSNFCKNNSSLHTSKRRAFNSLLNLVSCRSVRLTETSQLRENLILVYVQDLKTCSRNTSKESLKLDIIRSEWVVWPRMTSRIATPLHACCQTHSSDFLLKIKRTLYQQKSEIMGFHLIYNLWSPFRKGTVPRAWATNGSSSIVHHHEI